MVVSGLLKIETVAWNLSSGLPVQDFPSQRLPTPGRLQLRAQHTQEKQRQGLSQQVRVGRKIRREIALNMSAVKRQTRQPFATKIRCALRSTNNVESP